MYIFHQIWKESKMAKGGGEPNYLFAKLPDIQFITSIIWVMYELIIRLPWLV